MPNAHNISVKQSKGREIHHPSEDTNYAERVAKGKLRIARGDLQFQNDAERRDYEKRVASNPNNVPGMPAFFPPLKIQQMPVVNAARRCTGTIANKVQQSPKHGECELCGNEGELFLIVRGEGRQLSVCDEDRNELCYWKGWKVIEPTIEEVECGGCCIKADNFICPRCGKDNS